MSKKICVFCGARLGDSENYEKVAIELGREIIVLPGGFGTMDEFFEVLTLKQVGQFDKPIGLLNVNHFYDPLVTFMHHIIEKEFASIENLSFFYDRDNIGDLLDAMNL